jgi:predicted pyridoxine 5'-phosphate oxidase superfamily flavin-nucleotide-binding protein
MKAIPYHCGEMTVQEQAGTRPLAAQLAHILLTEFPAQARAFLAAQPLLVVSSADERGRLWASVLTGRPGFLQVPDANTLQITAQPVPGDVLAANLAVEAAVGTTAIDFATRRRIRLNGRAHRSSDGITVALDEVFFNCPKYIQARRWQYLPPPYTPPQAGAHTGGLAPEAQAWIARADTFFLATAHVSAGLDASHRGGRAGFVRVLNSRTLQWPDYTGNGMFQSLGNLALDPRAGLLFPDFTTGHVLQVTGRAHIDWNPAHAQYYPGAERLLTFRIDEVHIVEHALPFRWEFESYSPFDPPVASLENAAG